MYPHSLYVFTLVSLITEWFGSGQGISTWFAGEDVLFLLKRGFVVDTTEAGLLDICIQLHRWAGVVSVSVTWGQLATKSRLGMCPLPGSKRRHTSKSPYGIQR